MLAASKSHSKLALSHLVCKTADAVSIRKCKSSYFAWTEPISTALRLGQNKALACLKTLHVVGLSNSLKGINGKPQIVHQCIFMLAAAAGAQARGTCKHCRHSCQRAAFASSSAADARKLCLMLRTQKLICPCTASPAWLNAGPTAACAKVS